MNSICIETLPIEKKNKDEIEKIRKAAGNHLSSHAFASLFLWQHEMQLTIHIEKTFFAVKCGMRGENTWFFPCGEEAAVYDFINSMMGKDNFSLCYLSNRDACWLKENFPDKWELLREEESDEYICVIPDYVALEGSKYAELRKRIRHIDKNYSVQTKKLSAENIADARGILSEWRSESHVGAANGLTDEKIGETALDNMEFLEINGTIMYLDGKPEAMFAGFPINDDTVDALIGKCTPDAPNYTVYYAIHEFMKEYEGKAIYCNLEEDLGIAGIRMVKRKMKPEKKNEIWKAISI